MIALGEQDLYMRGLVTWVGFRQVAVPYERQARGAGEAHFPLLRSWGPVSSFVAGVTSFSHAPLIAFLLLGLAGGGISVLALAVLLLAGVVGAAASGTAWLVAFGTLMWSTLALGIGVIGLYLARIHREVLGRPRYIVESASGFDEPR